MVIEKPHVELTAQARMCQGRRMASRWQSISPAGSATSPSMFESTAGRASRCRCPEGRRSDLERFRTLLIGHLQQVPFLQGHHPRLRQSQNLCAGRSDPTTIAYARRIDQATAVREDRLVHLLAKGRIGRAGPGRPRQRPSRLVGDRAARIDEVSEAVGLSPRPLERLFLQQVGIGPKRLTRIVPFQRPATRLETGTPD
jgi:AraC-like DNA-binding protein